MRDAYTAVSQLHPFRRALRVFVSGFRRRLCSNRALYRLSAI
jgi:hypothetical protein